ncbi:MAG: M48 family metalloprotease [Prolixibacteraceae bacterium]|nr:M48 family metalloprotease [Prolixibacteraceae bacterium]
MKTLQHMLSNEFIEASGWMLVHSLWQGLLVLLVLSLMLWLMRKNSAQLRYLVSFFFLLVMLAWSVITFADAYQYAQEKTAIRAQLVPGSGSVKAYLAEHLEQQNPDALAKNAGINLKAIKVRSFLQKHFYWVCTFWMLGMLVVMLRMVGGLFYLQRLRTYGLMPVGEGLSLKLEQFAAQLNIRRKVEVFFSPLAKVPMTLGTFKPLILFPVTSMTGLSLKEVEAILVHELAHVLRHDYLFNIIQSVVEMLFFYHPAVWIISTQIRSERENSCDNLAIELTGDKLTYVQALAAYERIRMEQGDLAMAFASKKGSLINRIKRIQKQVAMKTNFMEGLIAALVVVTGLALVSFTLGNNPAPIRGAVPLNTEINADQPGAAHEPVVWTPVMIDSVQQALEENIQHSEELDQVSEEMKKMVEVALSERDAEASARMMEEINAALRELDLEGIVSEAMREVQSALEEVNFEEIRREIEQDLKQDIDREEIRRDLQEARRDMEEARREVEEARREVREEMRRDMRRDGVPEEIIELSVSAAEAGLNIASSVLENLPIDDIVHAALEGVGAAFEALDEIDFDELIRSVEADLNDSLSEEDIARLKADMEKQEQKLREQKEKLKVKEKEMKAKEKSK